MFFSPLFQEVFFFFRFPTVGFCRWWYFFFSHLRFFFSLRPLWVPMQTTMILYQSWEQLLLGGLLRQLVMWREFWVFLELRAKTCWWTHLGDDNAGTPQNLKPNKKRSPEPLGYHRVFERHLGRKISDIVPLVSWRNQPQPTTIQIDRRCADRLLEASEVSLGIQIDGSFYPRKKMWEEIGIPQNSKTPKNMWHPGIPKNWKSRMPNPCRISISDFCAEESFKWVAASPGRYPMAGSQKNSESKKTIQRKSSKNMWFLQVFGFTFSLSWWQALNKETTKNVAVFHTTIASFSWSLFRGTREECGKNDAEGFWLFFNKCNLFSQEHVFADQVEYAFFDFFLNPPTDDWFGLKGFADKKGGTPKHAPNHFWHFWVFVSNWDVIFFVNDMSDGKTHP